MWLIPCPHTELLSSELRAPTVRSATAGAASLVCVLNLNLPREIHLHVLCCFYWLAWREARVSPSHRVTSSSNCRMQRSLRKAPEIYSEHLNPPDTAYTLSMKQMSWILWWRLSRPRSPIPVPVKQKYPQSWAREMLFFSSCIEVAMFLHHPQMLSTLEG